jgi:hypothetical protein
MVQTREVLADDRFEKLTKEECLWFTGLLDASFPVVKEKLRMLTTVSQNLQDTGCVGAFQELTKEEEAQWKLRGVWDAEHRRLPTPSHGQSGTMSVSSARRPRPLGMHGLGRNF